MCTLVKTCTLDLGYILQQGGALPWLSPSQSCSESANILLVSQLFLSVKHNFALSNFTHYSLEIKAGDTVKKIY